MDPTLLPTIVSGTQETELVSEREKNKKPRGQGLIIRASEKRKRTRENQKTLARRGLKDPE